MNVRNIIEDNLIKLNNKEYLFEKKDNKYTSITFNEYIEKVKILASYLVSKRLKNKNILVFGKNSINFLIADTAVTIYTGVCINMNRDTKEEDLKDLVKSLNIKGILYTTDEEDKLKDIDVFKLNLDNFKFDNKITNNFKEYDENICSKIFFSSGTTGNPKGVKLSLKNVFAGWEPLQKRTPFTKDDIIYLFLPLHHTYGNIYNYYYSLISGLSIYLSTSINNIFTEIREVNPTIFCGVPLIFEKAKEAFKEGLGSAFGTNIKYIFVGGAPLDIKLRNTYKKYNLELLNAYALTETASSFSIDYPGTTDDDSVGTIFENIDVKIINENDGIGEILVKGDPVFLGYTNNDNVLDKDGYFNTGDLGYIKNNKLYLKGRKKKVLIGSNGENIFPDEIEGKLKEIDDTITNVKVSLKGNDISVIIYLKENKDINIIIDTYNKNCTQKNKIKEYKVSNEKYKEKLM